jgi:heptosyltransferase-2
MRTLVIHTAFPGDLILMTPLLDRLRRDPGLEWLGLVVTPACAPLFAGDPRLDELVVYDKRGADRGAAGYLRMARRLHACRPDRVLCPHRSLRSSSLAWLTGAWERVGFSSAMGSLAFTELVYDDRRRHEVERDLALGGPPEEGPALPSLHRDPGEEARVRELFEQHGLVLPVAMAPASLWATKRWPARHFGRLADLVMEAVPADIVLLGGPGDEELCLEVAAHVHNCRRGRAHVLAGRLSLRESFQALRLCRLAVVNDSAPLHLAQAARVPTLAVFGSTVPSFGFGPRGARDRVFQVQLNCIPCGIHGRRACPLGSLACLEQLEPEALLEAVVAEFQRGSSVVAETPDMDKP